VIRVRYKIAGAQFEQIETTIEAEDSVTLGLQIAAVRDQLPEIVELYDLLINARDDHPQKALEAAKAAVVDGLGATVLESTTSPVAPPPEASVTPIWSRPPEPVATTTTISTDVDPDF